jgi:hypothetical protein
MLASALSVAPDAAPPCRHLRRCASHRPLPAVARCSVRIPPLHLSMACVDLQCLSPGATGGEPPTSTVALVAGATGSAALQPSQKLFEGRLASACQRFDLTKPVFIEAESQKVRDSDLLLGPGASKS